MRQQQLRFAIAINIGAAEPRLLDAPAGQSDVQFLEIFTGRLAQDFDFLIRNQHHQIRQSVLIHIVKGNRGRVYLELFAEPLSLCFAISGPGYQRTLPILIDDHR